MVKKKRQKKKGIISCIFFQPQQYETRNLLQEEKLENHKYRQTKQHATKKPISH